MNGLSSLGAGVAQSAGAGLKELQKSNAAMALQQSAGQIAATAATQQQGFQTGLEVQKADLAKQAAVLADQLATTRGTTMQTQAGQIAATAATQAQGAATALEAQRLAGETVGRTQAGQIANEALTPEMKLLRALNVPMQGGGAQLPTPTNATTAPNGTPASMSGSASGTAPSPPGSSSVMDNPIVVKALGLPMAGSDAAIRMAIAQDINNDPGFKGKTAGQKAAEIENRLAVSKGTMTDPASREVLARAIAGYQKAPLDNMALMKGGGPETMSKVYEINPDYQEARYPEISRAMTAFGSGKQGDITRSLDVGVQHLALFDQAAQALKNGNVQILNSLKNQFLQQFGVSTPTTLDGLKQIVGTEIEKAVAGGIGASTDRDRLIKSLAGANSPDQLQDMTNGFRGLMAGQLKGLKRQYENDTGFKDGSFAFENKLDPETLKVLGPHSVSTTLSASPSSTGPGQTGAPSPASGPTPGSSLNIIPPPPTSNRPPLSSFLGTTK